MIYKVYFLIQFSPYLKNEDLKLKNVINKVVLLNFINKNINKKIRVVLLKPASISEPKTSLDKPILKEFSSKIIFQIIKAQI